MQLSIIKDAGFRQQGLGLADLKLYLLIVAFVAGNILAPWAVHQIPRGGLIFLPIYFFTLIAGYRYGLIAGLATAVLSPLANHFLTGMPPLMVLDAILVKSTTLALASALFARHFKLGIFLNLFLVILAYQVLGGAYEALKAGSLAAALGDWQIGWPGLVIQLVGGWAVLRLWSSGDRQDA